MQMYTTAGAVSLSLWKDTSSLKGQPSWQPSWHPTSKLWTTISDHQPFCVLEIKWCRWWCRRSNNPETFDGSLLLSVRTFWTWVELSCHVRFSPTLVSPAGEWPRKVPSFPVGDSTPPPPRQPGWIMESLATCVKSIDCCSWCASTFFFFSLLSSRFVFVTF